MEDASTLVKTMEKSFQKMTISLPSKGEIQTRVSWNLHRFAEITKSVSTSIKRGMDYSIDEEDDMVLEYDPEKSEIGISFFTMQAVPHFIPHSKYLGNKGVYYISVKDFDLPEGIGLIYDKDITLRIPPVKAKKSEKNEKEQIQKNLEKFNVEQHHFSLVCTRKMKEKDFLAKVDKFFNDKFILCDMKAAAEAINLVYFDIDPCADSDIRIIYRTICFGFEHLDDIQEKLFMIWLCSFLIHCKSLDDLLQDIWFSKIAFHLLEIIITKTDCGTSCTIKSSSVRTLIAKHFKWDIDLDYSKVTKIYWRQ